MADNLKQKAVSGMMWAALQKYSTMFIQFISGIILARLLTPYDYGCIGMLMIFIVLSESFIDGGFGSALIQKKHPTQEDYSTIFFWNIAMASVLYTVLFFSAPAISRFYNIPLLCSVLRVQGIIFFVYAFNVVQRNQLRKMLNFKVLSTVATMTSVVALVVTVLMAYYGFGVWSLVTQMILVAAIPAVVFWFYLKWRPSWKFSWQSFKELFGFGSFMFLTHILNQFGQQIQGLLIGKFFNPTTMGFYSKAQNTENLASLSISSVMTQVTYPLYAEVQDNRKSLGNMIKRITMTLAFLSFPLLFILILLAKPIFILLYSDRWIQSVPIFQVLCIAGLAGCLQSINLQAISAIGKSRTMFVWTLVKRIVGVTAVFTGLLFWDMKGLLLGVVFNYWFSYFVNIGLVSKHIGYKWYQQVKDLFPVAMASAVITLIVYSIGLVFHLEMYQDGLVKFLIYLLLYSGWSIVFKPEAYRYSLGILQLLKSKFNKRII